jgi:hypothetical protein
MEKGSVMRKLILCGLVSLFVGCTTQGHFKIPAGTQLEVYRRPVTVSPEGTVVTAPFFWTAAGIPPQGGIEYRLLKDNKEVKKGRLRANFRVVSIFWPPMAFIYWPMGFNPNITYDLVQDTQK